jgi:hypothetical protein
MGRSTEYGDDHSPRGAARPVQPFRKIAELNLFDANICDRYVDDIGTDASDPFVPSNRSESWTTASYNVAAVTSKVWDSPSMSGIVTLQERADMAAKYQIRFVFAMP